MHSYKNIPTLVQKKNPKNTIASSVIPHGNKSHQSNYTQVTKLGIKNKFQSFFIKAWLSAASLFIFADILSILELFDTY